MNLINGQIVNREESLYILDHLEREILETYSNEPLTSAQVIEACDTFSQTLNAEQHLPRLLSLGMTREKALLELHFVKQMLKREYLERRLEIEFGSEKNKSFVPFGSEGMVRQAYVPLGVLLHIAAGNVDALPVFSVLEGLLTGNINLLKLPGVDDGLSIPILQELMYIEPQFKKYVYVFDFPSENKMAMEKMATVADAIVVWGGDQAISAVRCFATPQTKLIEWGHKISFAYVSKKCISLEDLEGIAYNICDTEQLFCNSCQGIYLDTDRYEDVLAFSEQFLEVLERVSSLYPRRQDPFLEAQKTLELYTEELESVQAKKHVFRSKTCSVLAMEENKLEPSLQFRNCWVKPLNRKNLLVQLRKYKNHLQTVALVCDEEDRPSLETLFFRTGVVRITSGENMSRSYCGIPHDGEYPLRRYMKVTSCEY